MEFTKSEVRISDKALHQREISTGQRRDTVRWFDLVAKPDRHANMHAGAQARSVV